MTDRALTKDFNLSEFVHSETATRRGIDNSPAAEVRDNIEQYLAPGMQRIRDLLKVPVLISSGYRCEALNQAIGGSRTSQHMLGLAADFTAPRYGSPKAISLLLVNHADKLLFDQLIWEGSWVHVSFGPVPRRSILTAHFDKGRPRYEQGITA